MDDRTDPSAAFALRLVADLLTALVLNGTVTKGLGAVLVDEALNGVLESHPEYEEPLRAIAATLATQIGLAVVDLEAHQRKGG